MKSLILLSAASAATALSPMTMHKRQSKNPLGDLGILMDGGPKLAELMGSPRGTDQLAAFAQLLGAGPGKAGSFGAVMSQQNNGKYGRILPPADSAPEFEELAPRESTPNSRTVKIRYGPYLTPNMGIKNKVGEEGMLSNYPHLDVVKPCGTCTIIGMTAGIETPDGTNVNVNKGLWLHHFVLFNEGPGRQDATCLNRDISLPHVVVGTTAQKSERMWSAGNERMNLSFPKAGVTNAGYMMNEKDRMHLIVDLMNMNMQDAPLWLTITYDFVEGHPAGWSDVRPVWLDVAQCGTSEVNPPTQTGAYVLDYTWTANFAGEAITAVGHLHDGGTKLELLRDNQITCSSTAAYGETPEYLSTGGGHGHGRRQAPSASGHSHGSAPQVSAPGQAPADMPAGGHAHGGTPPTRGKPPVQNFPPASNPPASNPPPVNNAPPADNPMSGHSHSEAPVQSNPVPPPPAQQPAQGGSLPPVNSGSEKPKTATAHISSMTLCQKNTFPLKEVRPGQKWTMKAYYDYKAASGSVSTEGHQERVMGISILWVKKHNNNALKESVVPVPQPSTFRQQPSPAVPRPSPVQPQNIPQNIPNPQQNNPVPPPVKPAPQSPSVATRPNPSTRPPNPNPSTHPNPAGKPQTEPPRQITQLPQPSSIVPKPTTLLPAPPVSVPRSTITITSSRGPTQLPQPSNVLPEPKTIRPTSTPTPKGIFPNRPRPSRPAPEEEEEEEE